MECNPDRAVAGGLLHRLTTGERTRLVSLLMTALLFFLLMWNVLYGAVAFESMPRNDFGRPLLATELFVHGADMYGETEAVRYRYRFDRDALLYLWNLNPPHSHLVYLPLVFMSRTSALAVWFLLSGICLYASLRIIISELGIELTERRREWMALWLLSFSALAVAIVTAHLSFVFMLLTTLAWRDARRGGWGRAGCWLGLTLSIKPFLLIFVPYLLLKRCWRGLAGMGLTVMAAFSVGALIFGIESHRSWLATLSKADSWAWLPLNASLYGVLSRVFLENPIFTSALSMAPGQVRTAWLALGIPMGILAMLRCVSGPILEGVDRAFAVLLVTALLLSPLGWIYYFWLPVGPVAALAQSWCAQRRLVSGRERYRLGSVSGYLFVAAMVGMAIPTYLTPSWQPSAWATVSIGSVPFWSLLLLWLALVLDRLKLGSIRDLVTPASIQHGRARGLGRELVSGAR